MPPQSYIFLPQQPFEENDQQNQQPQNDIDSRVEELSSAIEDSCREISAMQNEVQKFLKQTEQTENTIDSSLKLKELISKVSNMENEMQKMTQLLVESEPKKCEIDSSTTIDELRRQISVMENKMLKMSELLKQFEQKQSKDDLSPVIEDLRRQISDISNKMQQQTENHEKERSQWEEKFSSVVDELRSQISDMRKEMQVEKLSHEMELLVWKEETRRITSQLNTLQTKSDTVDQEQTTSPKILDHDKSSGKQPLPVQCITSTPISATIKSPVVKPRRIKTIVLKTLADSSSCKTSSDTDDTTIEAKKINFPKATNKTETPKAKLTILGPSKINHTLNNSDTEKLKVEPTELDKSKEKIKIEMAKAAERIRTRKVVESEREIPLIKFLSTPAGYKLWPKTAWLMGRGRVENSYKPSTATYNGESVSLARQRVKNDDQQKKSQGEIEKRLGELSSALQESRRHVSGMQNVMQKMTELHDKERKLWEKERLSMESQLKQVRSKQSSITSEIYL